MTITFDCTLSGKDIKVIQLPSVVHIIDAFPMLHCMYLAVSMTEPYQLILICEANQKLPQSVFNAIMLQILEKIVPNMEIASFVID